MSTATATVEVVEVQDHEGFGVCGHCGREGLRWIVVLSDGTSLGSGCMKKVLGWNVAPKKIQWAAGYEKSLDLAENLALYTHKARPEFGVIARGPFLQASGPTEWLRRQYAWAV